MSYRLGLQAAEHASPPRCCVVLRWRLTPAACLPCAAAGLRGGG
jgi:hypothetical protein